MKTIQKMLITLGLWVLSTPLMADIGTGLLVQYGFEGNTMDSSPYSHHGTIYGAPSYGSGAIGQAISLNGAGDYVTVPVMYNPDASELTFSGWFYIDSGKTQQTLFANGEGGELIVQYDSGSLFFKANTVNDSWQTLTVNGGVPVDTWAHFAWVYRKGVGLETWINGSLAGTLPLNDSLLYNPTGWHSHVGAYNGNSDSYSFQGMVDDFRVHERALNATDIMELYALGISHIASYEFNGDLNDSTGLHGEMILSGVSVGSTYLDVSAGDYGMGYFAATPQLFELSYNGFSISTKVFRIDDTASVSDNLILNMGYGYRWFGLRVSAGGKLEFYMNNMVQAYEFNQLPINFNQWHAIDFSVDFVNGQARAVVDGQTQAFSFPPVSIDHNNENQFHTINPGNGTYFRGYIDYLRITNTLPSMNGDPYQTSGINSEVTPGFPSINYAMPAIPEGKYDLVHFTVPVAQEVALFTTSGDDTVGTLYDGSDNLIAENDDYDGDTNFRILTHLAAGNYTLKIKGFSDAAVGAYAVTLANNDDGSYGGGGSSILEAIAGLYTESNSGDYGLASGTITDGFTLFGVEAPSYIYKMVLNPSTVSGSRFYGDYPNGMFEEQPMSIASFSANTIDFGNESWRIDINGALDMAALNALFSSRAIGMAFANPASRGYWVYEQTGSIYNKWLMFNQAAMDEIVQATGGGAEPYVPEPSITVYAPTPASAFTITGATDQWNSGANSGSVTHTAFFIVKNNLFESGGGHIEAVALVVPGYTNTLNLGNPSSYQDWTGYLPDVSWFTPLSLPLEMDRGYELHVVYYSAPSAASLQDAMALWPADGPPATQYLIGEKKERIYLEVGSPEIVFGRDLDMEAVVMDANFALEARYDTAQVAEVNVTVGGYSGILPNNNHQLVSTYAAFPEGSSLSVTVIMQDSNELFYEYPLPMKYELDPHLSASAAGVGLGVSGSVLNLSFTLNQDVESVYARAELYRNGARIDEETIERWGGVAAGSNSFTETVEKLFSNIQTGDEIRINEIHLSTQVGIVRVINRVTSVLSAVYQGPGAAFAQSFAAGWNLAALPYSQSLSASQILEKGASITAVWVMRNGQWQALGGDTATQATLDSLGIAKITAIEPGEGFWVQAKSAFSVSYSQAATYNLLTHSRLTGAAAGWHLLGSGSALTPAQIVAAKAGVRVIWGFKAGQWRVYSPDTQLQGQYSAKGVSTLTSIAQGDGLWVKVQ